MPLGPEPVLTQQKQQQQQQQHPVEYTTLWSLRHLNHNLKFSSSFSISTLRRDFNLTPTCGWGLRHRLAVAYRRFGTTYRPHLQGSSNQKIRHWKPFTMRTMLSRNVCNQPPTNAVQHSRTAKTKLQLHYNNQLVFTAQADFTVRI
jgi:hypothetical protein